MADLTRRAFQKSTLGLLLTHSLLESLFDSEAIGSEVRPIADRWLAEVDRLGRDLKGEELDPVTWQKKIEELFEQVNVEEFLTFIDFDKLTENLRYRERGERAIQFRFPKVDGLPTQLVFGHQIFALKEGQSVAPHGHNNMATAFLILDGEFHGRHYDRLEESDEFMVVRPTIDETFGRGQCSTVSDQKDNVHWFRAKRDGSFIFNIHVLNVDPDRRDVGRVYIDPDGEKLEGGLIKAPKISHREAYHRYG